jgi:hypothetical protein
MAYDGKSKTVVLYGGFQDESPSGSLNDTWTWDGSAWTKQTPTTTPLAGPAYLAYDAVGGRLWLLTIDGAMWYWSGGNWLKQGTYPQFTNRIQASMLFDDAIGKILLYGGTTVTAAGNMIENDLWTWSGTDWSKVT